MCNFTRFKVLVSPEPDACVLLGNIVDSPHQRQVSSVTPDITANPPSSFSPLSRQHDHLPDRLRSSGPAHPSNHRGQHRHRRGCYHNPLIRRPQNIAGEQHAVPGPEMPGHHSGGYNRRPPPFHRRGGAPGITTVQPRRHSWRRSTATPVKSQVSRAPWPGSPRLSVLNIQPRSNHLHHRGEPQREQQGNDRTSPEATENSA